MSVPDSRTWYRPGMFVALSFTFACGVMVDVPTAAEPERPPRPVEQCVQFVSAYCRECHLEQCDGWTVYDGVCGLGDCLHALELCPPEWPQECRGGLDRASFNDCD